MINALALTGPTASGKTVLSLLLAERLGCEIISLDSMQIYKGMDIGTAKADESERKRVAHHMLDVVLPTDSYSTESYRKEAVACAAEIEKRGKIPLFVGGTGLYLDTLMRTESKEVPASDPKWREELLSAVKTDEDIDKLWQRLADVDPVSSEKIHKNNVRRVARALEIYEKTGKPKSYFDELSTRFAPDIKIGLITIDFHDREVLYERINKRVDQMLDAGLADEVRALYQNGLLKEGTTASQAIGYKELLSFILGEVSLEEAIENIKLSTRRYAKRQITWFRHEKDAERIYADGEDGRLLSVNELFDLACSAAQRLLNK